jgi:hypothetical protein
VDDAVAGRFEGAIGIAFVEVSEGSAWTVYLNSEALLLPEAVDHHAGCSFGWHVPIRAG